MFGRKRGFSTAEIRVIEAILGTSSDPRAETLQQQVKLVESVSRHIAGARLTSSADYVKGPAPLIFDEVASRPVLLELEDGSDAVFSLKVSPGGIFWCLIAEFLESARPPRNWMIHQDALSDVTGVLIDIPEPNHAASDALADAPQRGAQ